MMIKITIVVPSGHRLVLVVPKSQAGGRRGKPPVVRIEVGG